MFRTVLCLLAVPTALVSGACFTQPTNVNANWMPALSKPMTQTVENHNQVQLDWSQPTVRVPVPGGTRRGKPRCAVLVDQAKGG